MKDKQVREAQQGENSFVIQAMTDSTVSNGLC